MVAEAEGSAGSSARHRGHLAGADAGGGELPPVLEKPGIAGLRSEKVPRELRSLRPSRGIQLAKVGDCLLAYLRAMVRPDEWFQLLLPFEGGDRSGCTSPAGASPVPVGV